MVAANNGDGIPQTGEIAGLHNPEGIVFGPHGRLYVTTFRVDASDNKILVLDVAAKKLVDSIPLGSLFAQSLLFGPGDELYVPITGGGTASGSIRTYDVATKGFETLVLATSSGGGLQTPWYLTFKQTNPATLAYQPWHNFVDPLDANGSGDVTAADALVIINELSRQANVNADGRLSSSRGKSKFYYDVLGNGFISSLGALRVINSLAAPTNVLSEGERLQAF